METWKELMKQAKELGISKDEVRTFLRRYKQNQMLSSLKNQN